MMRTRKAIPLLVDSLLCFAAACSDHSASDDAARTAGARQGSHAGLSGVVSVFPGAGTGNAGSALPSGDVCDLVIKSRNMHLVTPEITCFSQQSGDYVVASVEQVLECIEGSDTVHVRLTFDPGFVDNTYGANAVGWPRKGHTMDKDLTHSDHAEISASNGAGETVVRFKLDYISRDPSAPSGWGSLGVRGGDGKMLVGDPDWIVQWNTSLSRNFNERGYAAYDKDSPQTDENYTVNADAPEWDYRVVYEAWIDAAAFGESGFGDASIAFVHASPAKTREHTLKVEPDDCPCQPDDPNCVGTGGTGGSEGGCQPDDPNCVGTGGVGGSSSDCGPDDPNCVGTGGVGGSSGDCGPDDPMCTGQGGMGGRGSDCPPDDPMCFGNGTVAGAPSTPPSQHCPPDQPECSPE